MPVSLTCIGCSTTLVAGQDQYRCPTCGRTFDVVAGIVDLRGELEGFDTDADQRLALELDAADATFEELLRQYWRKQPQVRSAAAERFVLGDLRAGDRAMLVAEQIASQVGARTLTNGRVLEVGAGTGALGAALARQAALVVVTDVSLAWLVLAKRRMQSSALDDVTLIACAGDRLPFPSQAFDLVVGADVIEHVPDAGGAIRSCARVLRGGGWLWVSTPNRWSLTPEPHVRLWGVGLLPRPVARQYVRRFRNLDYGDIHTLSRRQLQALLSVIDDSARVRAPSIVAPVQAGYSRPARRLIDLYNMMCRSGLGQRVLLLVGPLFHGVAQRRDDAETAVSRPLEAQQPEAASSTR